MSDRRRHTPHSHARASLASRIARGLTTAGLLLTAGGGQVLLAGPAQAAVQAELHVAPNGTGTACSATSPCSLTQAQQRVRALAPTMTGDIVVTLQGGTYHLTAPLSFSSADSGTGGHVVRWQAAPGARPVLSSARSVGGWSEVAGSPGLWRAPVAAGVDFRQIYVDGTRAVRARGGFAPAGFTATSTGYTTTAAASLATWKNQSDIELGYRTLWTYSRCPVASAAATTVTMAQPCWKNAHSSPYLQNDKPLWIENAFELLDTPGEWYLDRTGAVGTGTPTLYYRPLPGQQLTGTGAVTVTHPTLERLLVASGSGPGDRLHDVQFIGLTFADSSFLRPNSAEGFAEEQANFTLVGPNASHWIYSGSTKTPGAVVIGFATNVLFQGNTLTRLGGAGLDVERSSNTVTVLGNEVTDVSANGIQIGDITDADQRPAAADRMHDITVSNNYVHDVAVEFQGGVGIFGGFVDGLKVLHNEVADVPYTGISIGWGWGYLDEGGLGDGTQAGPSTTVQETTPTIAGNTQVIGNYVHDYFTAGSDGGAVYTLGAQPNSLVRDNYFANAPDSANARGIYLDNGTKGYLVTANVVDRTSSWLLVNEGANSLSNPAAKGNTITGNWSNQTSRQCCSSLNTYSNNIDTVSGSNWPTAAWAVIDAAGLQTAAVDPSGVQHNWRAELHGTRSTTDLARTATPTTTNAYSATYSGRAAIDGNAQTRWATTDGTTTANLELTWSQPTSLNRVVLREAKQYDPRIERYTVDYWNGQSWVTVVTGLYPGVAETSTFPTVTTTKLRLSITASAPGPTVQGFEVYKDPATTSP
ncbi:parallel beta helix pectate lyase-like protein [Knoellia remsis]|uniref:Parallel beta helix pectate lyase-like protein n=1 Tax=Knoellia remsis TaxID=407159 RepID=A0A2T0U4V9_9MICO|nr:discoidin domain-containing protein [Knoellia remsis]PRY52878.1 parallel beta helix pectate lyase-like protein [Knoellia remsis]